MRDPRTPRRRLAFLAALGLLWSLVILVRLVQVQVYRAEDLRDLAARQHSSTVELDPVRGTIRDRHGEELALTRDLRSVYAIPGLIASPDTAATRLAGVLHIDRRKLLARLRMRDRNFVWVERKVSDEEARAVEALGIEGIAFLEEPRRFYPRGSLAAHLLGFVGLDNEGLAGLEQQYDSQIRGVPGVKLTLRDARGLRFLPEPGGLPAEPGRNLVLTLDGAIQYRTERELRAAVRDHGAQGGVAIVLDPWNGDILAMAAEPTFDPNRYARFPPEARRNPAVQTSYEPGSTFKMITFAAALAEGRLEPEQWIDCGRGHIIVSGRRIKDHHSYDRLTATQVLARSSNVGAIVIGSRLAPERLYRHIRQFGFGEPTRIDLPGESGGLLRPPRDWSGTSRASISMGQEIGVSPLQLTMAAAAIANGGILMRPRLLLRVEEHGGRVVRETPPAAVRRVLAPAHVATLKAMLEEVVRTGTGKAAAIPGIQVAGKTGTAQKAVGGTYAAGYYVASFVAFAPSPNPRLVCLVVLDEPRGGAYYGGQIAAPVVGRILAAALPLVGTGAQDRRVDLEIREWYREDSPAPRSAPAVHVARR